MRKMELMQLKAEQAALQRERIAQQAEEKERKKREKKEAHLNFAAFRPATVDHESSPARLLNGVKALLDEIIKRVMRKGAACRAFEYPVTEEMAPGYDEVVKEPMCLSEMTSRVESGACDGVSRQS